LQNNIDLSGLIEKAREEGVVEIHISKHLPHYKTFFKDLNNRNLTEKESIVIFDYYPIYEEAIENNSREKRIDL
jgi:DNA-binding transcriptional regulator LsrR (DeoR family)